VARAADVPLAVDLLRYMAEWATKVEGKTIPISVPGCCFHGTSRRATKLGVGV
jgi:phenylacetaldehyde dehydrogenase